MKRGAVRFKTPISEEIFNFKTGEKCRLVSGDNPQTFSEKDIGKLVRVCNQPMIYDFLFRTKLNGQAYQNKDAESYFKLAIDGWKRQNRFIFFVRDNRNEIIATLNINSGNLNLAEVGYWVDNNFSGIMSNALEKLIEIAKNAGYKQLFAVVRFDNERSKNVLLRNNFVPNGSVEGPYGMRLKFVRRLN